MTTVRLEPDWMLVGAPASEWGMVMVVASRTLEEVDLRAVFSLHDPAPFSRLEFAYYQLRGTMHTVVVAYGQSYGEALRRLFEQWEPDRPDQPLPLRPLGELPPPRP